MFSEETFRGVREAGWRGKGIGQVWLKICLASAPSHKRLLSDYKTESIPPRDKETGL